MNFAKVFYSSEKLHRIKLLKRHVDGLNMRWEENIFQVFLHSLQNILHVFACK